MHTTRAMLDAEALVLCYLGVLSVAVPQAFIQLLTGGQSSSALGMLVPWLGVFSVVVGVSQLGLLAVGHPRSVRVLLQARLVGDLLVAVSALIQRSSFADVPVVLSLEAASLAFFFSATRFYALVLMSDMERAEAPAGR